jgi:hypothetical protein
VLLARHAAPFLFYLLIALFATFPLLLHLHSRLPAVSGEQGQDVWQSVWNIWWVHRALFVEHTNPYQTDMLFYPQGAGLILHTLNLPLALVGALLIPLVGVVASYNLVTLLTLALAGYCSFLLARYLTGNSLAALVAGTIVLCSPMRLNQVRLALLASFNDFVIPLALLALLVALRRQTWRAAALAAGALLLAALSNWYHLFHLVLLLAVLSAGRLLILSHARQWATLRQEATVMGRVGVLGMAMLLPFVLPALMQAFTQGNVAKTDDLITRADLTSLIPIASAIWQPVPPDWYAYDIFSLVTVLLALAGLLLAPRQTWGWALAGAVFLLLSLGPSLYVGGEDTGILLPYALLRDLPVIEGFRGTARLNTVTTLLLALVAAVGMARLFQHTGRRAAAVLAGGAIVLLIITSVRLPFPERPAAVSPFFAQVTAEPGAWSLIEFPFNRPDRAGYEMYTQTHHGKYLLTGHLSRPVPPFPYESFPPLAAVELADTRPDIVGLPPEEQAQLLRSLRVRYLLFRSDPLLPGRMEQQIDAAQTILGPLSEVYASDTLYAYRLDNVADWLDHSNGTTEEMPLVLGLRASTWQALEPGAQGLSRWLTDQPSQIWAYTLHPRRAVLELELYSLAGERPLEVWINGELAQTLTIQAGSDIRRYQCGPFDLPAGASIIELYAPEGGVSPQALGLNDEDDRLLSLSVHRIEAHPIEYPD